LGFPGFVGSGIQGVTGIGIHGVTDIVVHWFRGSCFRISMIRESVASGCASSDTVFLLLGIYNIGNRRAGQQVFNSFGRIGEK
jgi:hypothetical protein